jgi:hypothetical protein
MIEYREFRPTAMDPVGICLPDRQNWLLAPVAQNRDSGIRTRSNFQVVLKSLEEVAGDNDDVEVHRFGHWGNGWFEIILVRPDTQAAADAQDWEAALADYPIADENHLSDLEWEAAARIWEQYSWEERIEHIRENRDQFEFSSLADMKSCAKGVFTGSPRDLLG